MPLLLEQFPGQYGAVLRFAVQLPAQGWCCGQEGVRNSQHIHKMFRFQSGKRCGVAVSRRVTEQRPEGQALAIGTLKWAARASAFYRVMYNSGSGLPRSFPLNH